MNSSESNGTTRDLVILSHANPEDNEFARWLALRLVSEGYPIWIDLINLKGGEDVWKTIEKIIRERAVKFLYVLSRNSNQKEGVLQELSVAKAVARNKGLQDFIIPLHVDDLPFAEINIEINRQNAIPFESGWSRGLKQLLEVLERERVAKHPDYTPSIATSWWREQFSAEKGVITKPEEYISSWFPLDTFPQKIFFHLLYKTKQANDEDGTVVPPSPFYGHKNGIISFAPKEDFDGVIINGQRIVDTHKYPLDQFLAGKYSDTFIDYKTARNVVVNILEQAWKKMVEQRGLSIHEMANETWCFHFIKDQVDKDKIKFVGINGKTTYRSIVGYRRFKRSGRTRIWHFGISAKAMVYPVSAFNIKPHVLFSDDGIQIWSDANRLHKARMNQCRGWWNDQWRDRILATIQWLANGNGFITLPVSNDLAINLNQSSLNFVSPVSYIDPGSSSVSAIEETPDEVFVEEVDEREELDEDDDEEKDDEGE